MVIESKHITLQILHFMTNSFRKQTEDNGQDIQDVYPHYEDVDSDTYDPDVQMTNSLESETDSGSYDPVIWITHSVETTTTANTNDLRLNIDNTTSATTSDNHSYLNPYLYDHLLDTTHSSIYDDIVFN